MFILDSVQCADAFPSDGAGGGPGSPILVAQNGSNGGYAQVTGADAYVSLAYTGDRGVTLEWTPPMHVAPGNIILQPGTRGIKFRNYVAGSIATVSAGLSEPAEPAMQLTAAGVASSAGGTMVTGIIPAAGTTPTGGTGFTYTHTNGSGVYVFTFTTAFAATPDIQATLNVDPVATSAGAIGITPIGAAGFTVRTASRAGVAADLAFSFLAAATV